MITQLRRRALRLIDGMAAALIALAVARAVYVFLTPLSLETLTVGPVLAVSATVYIAAMVLSVAGLGAVLMLFAAFRRRPVRARAMVAYLAGVLVFVGLSVGTEAWINAHRHSHTHAAPG